MIKVSNKAPNAIKVGNIVIPAFGSVLLDSVPSTMEASRLLNKGVLSIYYVPNEVKPVEVVENTTSETSVNSKNVNVESTESVTESVTESATEPEVKSTTRKRRTKAVDVTTDENLMKGDMNNASDND